jgi:hypothetical protein
VNEPVWTYRMGCSGWLGVLIVGSLILMFFLVAIALLVGFFITYAVVSAVANAVAGPDPEPSPSFWTRLGEGG